MKAEYNYDDSVKPALLARREFYEEVLHQDRRCLICRNRPKRLRINLDAKTGKFRGLLCRRCAKGLELFDNSFVSLTNAAKFVDKPLLHHSNSRVPVVGPDNEPN